LSEQFSNPRRMSKTRRLWLFRPARQAAIERAALEDNVLVLDFNIRGDLSGVLDIEEITAIVEEANPGEKLSRLESRIRQMHLLIADIQDGDLIVMPVRRNKTYSIGMARPERKTCADDRPGRAVEWLRTDIPEASFMPDLIHSMNAQQNVCAIERNDAMPRLEAILAGNPDPGPGQNTRAKADYSDAEIEDFMFRKSLAVIGSAFAGHDLAGLVAALLEIEGLSCQVSPPGPDGGIDILAGRGLLAITDSLVVQVKSGSIIADTPTFQQLFGAMSDTGARQGLLVAWGGFAPGVRTRIRENWFKVRVWDSADVTRAVLRHYADLPLWIRDRLGFRQIWIA